MRGKIEFSRAQLVWCTYISSIEILMQRVLIRDRMERRKSEFVRFQFLTPLIRGGKNLIFFSRPGVMFRSRNVILSASLLLRGAERAYVRKSPDFFGR